MKKNLAFGIEPSNRRFRLRLARYMGLVDAVKAFRAHSLNRSRPLKLLDIGAGQGRSMQYLHANDLDHDIEFYGIDNEKKRQDRLFKPERWNYQLLDAEQGLPFEDEMFDVIVCEQVLEHLHDPGFVLEEIARVLKPNGMAVLGVPSFPPGLAAIRCHVIPRIDRLTGKNRDHEQVFTKAKFIELIERRETLSVQRVQAFRCFSGGPFAWLENFRWWYRLNRRVATALSAVAIEIQVIVERVPVHATACAMPGGVLSASRGAPILPVFARFWPVMLAIMLYVLALIPMGWLLSDGTHARLFHDTMGVAVYATGLMWFAAAGATVWLLRARMKAALTLAGAAVFVGLVEVGFLHAITDVRASGAVAALVDHSTTLPVRVALATFLGLGAICLLLTAHTLWQLIGSSRGSWTPWVRLVLLCLVFQIVSEVIERSEQVLANSLSIPFARSLDALEEGLEFALPICLLVTIGLFASTLSTRAMNRTVPGAPDPCH